MWGVPKLRDIPLGSAKVLGLRFLGFVTSGLLNLQRGISLGFITFTTQVYPPFFVCLPVEWREFMKRLLPVRLGVRKGPLGKHPR